MHDNIELKTMFRIRDVWILSGDAYRSTRLRIQIWIRIMLFSSVYFKILPKIPGLRIRIDLMRIRIQHFSKCGSGFRIRIPDPDPGFDDLKLKEFTARNFLFYFLDQKLQFIDP
jgi:hypothetical protein